MQIVHGFGLLTMQARYRHVLHPDPSPKSSSGISRYRFTGMRLNAHKDQEGQDQVAPGAWQGLRLREVPRSLICSPPWPTAATSHSNPKKRCCFIPSKS